MKVVCIRGKEEEERKREKERLKVVNYVLLRVGASVKRASGFLFAGWDLVVGLSSNGLVNFGNFKVM